MTPRRLTGLALFALMIVHPFLRPERGWVYLSACDIAALVTAAGLVVPSDRALAAAFVFQVMAGIPALTIGILTGTYPVNPTGIAVHLVPPILAIAMLRTLPRGSAALAWLGALAAFFASMVLAPPALNLNFSDHAFGPVAATFGNAGFDVAMFALAAVLLFGGEPLLRRALGRGA